MQPDFDARGSLPSPGSPWQPQTSAAPASDQRPRRGQCHVVRHGSRQNPSVSQLPARELPLSFHTEAFESSETEKENYCLLRAEILLNIPDLGVRYLFHRNLTSPLLVRGPHYTHVYWQHAVYCQTLRQGQGQGQ